MLLLQPKAQFPPTRWEMGQVNQEEVLPMIVVGEGICRVEESIFLEVEKSTMQSLQLMRRLKS